MTDKQLKNRLLTELVNQKGIAHNGLLEIFDKDQEKLNLIAKEFKLNNYANIVETDQIGVIQMSSTREAKIFLDHGGF